MRAVEETPRQNRAIITRQKPPARADRAIVTRQQSLEQTAS